MTVTTDTPTELSRAIAKGFYESKMKDRWTSAARNAAEYFAERVRALEGELMALGVDADTVTLVSKLRWDIEKENP